MCLSCQYGIYNQKCKICDGSMCREVAHRENNICYSCYTSGKVQFVSICRECLQIFPSRNGLFRHLNSQPEHKREFNMKIVESHLVWNIYKTKKYFPANTWMEQYCILGFRA